MNPHSICLAERTLTSRSSANAQTRPAFVERDPRGEEIISHHSLTHTIHYKEIKRKAERPTRILLERPPNKDRIRLSLVQDLLSYLPSRNHAHAAHQYLIPMLLLHCLSKWSLILALTVDLLRGVVSA